MAILKQMNILVSPLPELGGQKQVTVALPSRFVDGGRVELGFRFDYTAPIDLRVSEGFGLRRIAYDRWAATAEGPYDEDSLVVRWVEPFGRAHLTHVESFPEPLDSEVQDYDILAAYDAARGSLEQAPGPEHRSKLFWISFDLAASFEAIQGREGMVAQRLGLPVELWHEILGPEVGEHCRIDKLRTIEKLQWFLDMRARQRAVLHAAGHAPGLLLPWSPGFQLLAERVSRLLLAVLHLFFEKPDGSLDLDDVWDAFLLFASGQLAVPMGTKKLNMEPNSASIVCFSELVDLAGDLQRTGLPSDVALECLSLRPIFVAGLAPYFETYRSPDPRPRRASRYRRRNLPPLPGAHPPYPRNPRWEPRRLNSLRRDYRQAELRDPEELEAWLQTRWGQELVEALRDEPEIARVLPR